MVELGLTTTGRKVTLQDRLLEHYGLNADSEDDDTSADGDAASVYDNAGSSPSRAIPSSLHSRTPFTLRDIEDSLTSFSGSGSLQIEEWLDDFQQNAIAVHWNELQKFIYAKHFLKGAATIFIRSQRDVTDWNSLMQALRSEFGTKVSSIEVHRMLRNRRKRSNEDLREYLYSLMEIGKPIRLDDMSLIEYFIEGIPDSRQNKINLYQAKSIAELKEQIRV